MSEVLPKYARCDILIFSGKQSVSKRRLRGQLLASSALICSALATVLYTTQSALAACDGNTVGTSICSGADAAVTVGATGNLELQFNNQTVTTGGVTINSGANPFDLSLNVVSASGPNPITNAAGAGVSVISNGGAISVVTLAGSTIQGSTDGITVETIGAGGVTVTAHGVTATSGGNGITARSADGLIIIHGNGGINSAMLNGIDARATGSGGIAIDTSAVGTINAANNGISAQADLGVATITTGGAINAGYYGITATSSDNLSITANADVVAGDTGIGARSMGIGSVTVGGAGNVAGTNSGGIAALRTGLTTSGDVRVTGTGATTSANGFGIAAFVQGVGNNANILIDRSGTITAGTTGISAITNGGGNIAVTGVGNVTGGNTAGNFGIEANASGGNVIVSASGAVSGADGIHATTTGAGTVTVTALGVTSTVGNGIAAQSVDGLVTIHGNGAINAMTGGIYVATNGIGAIAIETTGAGTVNANGTGIYGVAASGSVTITTGGTVTSTGDHGVAGFISNVAGTGNLSITANADIVAANNGIFAKSNGVGSVTAGGSGNVTSTNGIGIFAINSGVTASGDVIVTGTGSTTSINGIGIAAAVAGSDNDANILINRSGAIASGTTGIHAATDGGGNITIAGIGNVTAGNAAGDYGIRAVGTGGNVVVSVNGAVSAAGGIDATTTGTGAITVGAHNVTATVGDGITASTGTGRIAIATDGLVDAAGTGIALTGGTGNSVLNFGTISGVTGITTTSGSTSIANAGTITGSGGMAIQFGGSGNTLTLTSTSVVNGLAIGTGSDTFQLGGSSAGTFDVSALGPGQQYQGFSRFNKVDSSTWNLIGNSAFAGPSTVKAGDLRVNGSLANSVFTVENGAILGGNGTVGGIVALAGSIIAPGNSIGTLNVAGNVGFAAGSAYQVELTSAGQSDRINATGTATIANGAILNVVKLDAAPYVLGTRYTVLEANGGVSGIYTLNGNTALSAFIGLVDHYDPTHVYLDVAQTKSFAAAGLTPNQIATGGGVESLGGGNPLFNAVIMLPTDAAAQGAFDQLSGEVHASALTAMLEDSRFVRNAVNDRIRAAFDGVGATNGNVVTYEGGKPRAVAATTDGVSVWGQGFGAWGHWNSDGNAARLERSIGGFFFGADAPVFDTWRFGAVAGYSSTSFNAKDHHSSGSSDNYHLGLYGGTQWGDLAFRTGAAYTWHDISTTRSVAFPGFGDSLKGDYNAATAQAFGELGYRMQVGNVALEPFGNLAYVNLHTDGFTEKGGAAALTSGAANTDVTFTTLGLRASTSFTLGGTEATARGMLGWRHAFSVVSPNTTMRFASGGDAFSIGGVPIARDAAVVEAGLDFALSPTATFGISYGGQFGSGVTDQSVKANFNVKF